MSVWRDLLVDRILHAGDGKFNAGRVLWIKLQGGYVPVQRTEHVARLFKLPLKFVEIDDFHSQTIKALPLAGKPNSGGLLSM